MFTNRLASRSVDGEDGRLNQYKRVVLSGRRDVLYYARTVIGYHGCDLDTAEQILSGSPFTPSTNDYDWLGRGVYFWEFGPDRAWRFAQAQARRGRIKTPAIIGAQISLGRCFDLLDTQHTRNLQSYYPLWLQFMNLANLPIPENRGALPDRKGRYLDCAIINGYLDIMKSDGAFHDTVRGCFREGSPAWPDAGIYVESHIQVAVRNTDNIIGVFRPTHTQPPGE